MLICSGTGQDKDTDYGYDYIEYINVALKNFISRDPDGVLKVGPG